MSENLPHRFSLLIHHWLDQRSAQVNHQAVMKDIYLEVGISAGYFVMLTLANLIALSGLITNSTAVIIGAMLVSPLMGPILSTGFAFITGDTVIGRKAMRKLVLSVIFTVIVATLATFLSPLKEVTPEILARTRPNLYDLIIAFLAGTAGAIAICTKKNYITVVPGVAIATAVIPPLSVAGYGLGSGQWMMALGGFFLFFTNFVAIVVCTCIIFYIYGFRPAMETEEDVGKVKKRVAMLAGLLFVISIPLIYTLVTSISAIRLKSGIETVLRKEFDQERYSHLVSANYRWGKDDVLEVSAVVNTVKYLNEDDLKRVEKILADNLQNKVVLNLEQIQVQAGGLKGEQKSPIMPGVAPPKPSEEVTRSSIEGAVSVVRKVSDKIEKVIAPSVVAGFQVGFADGKNVVSALMKIRRDQPLSEEQRRWLQQIVSSELNMPVEVRVEIVPFIPLLTFADGGTALSEAMKNSLAEVKKAYGMEANLTILVESFPAGGSRTQAKQAEERGHAVAVKLKENGIPEEKIRVMVNRKKTATPPAVQVTLLSAMHFSNEKAGK